MSTYISIVIVKLRAACFINQSFTEKMGDMKKKIILLINNYSFPDYFQMCSVMLKTFMESVTL